MSRRRAREAGLAAVMLAPSFAVLAVFVLYPLGRAVWLGHQRCRPDGSACRSNGWDQYVDVARSSEFLDALAVTAKFALLTVPTGIVLGVLLAVLADKHLRGMRVFRIIFSSTVATSVAVSSLMFLFLLHPSVGALRGLFDGPTDGRGLLAHEDTAIFAVAATSVWANLGFTFIVVTAGLQSIPRDLYESAYVDGAGGTRRFVDLTLPLLGPTLLFVGVVLVSRAFQTYGEFDLLTDGGPRGSTTTITYLVYGRSSVIRGDLGLQSAVAVLLFGVLLVVSLAQFALLSKRVHRVA